MVIDIKNISDNTILISCESRLAGTQYDNYANHFTFKRPTEFVEDELVIYIKDNINNFAPINLGFENTLGIGEVLTQTTILKIQIAFQRDNIILNHSNQLNFSLRESIKPGVLPPEAAIHKRYVDMQDEKTLLEAKAYADTIPGRPGADGAKGDIGLTGATGAKGDIGLTGATGAKGDIGLTGATGAKGDIGLTGATGAKGDIGLTGATGPKGDIGLNGATGAKGDTGDTGPAGADGKDGKDGVNGRDGIDGRDGADGGKGDTGAQGLKGNTGATGPAGPIGLTGASGQNGLDGKPGRKLIRRIKLEKDVYQVTMTEDDDGKPFSIENGFELLFEGRHVRPEGQQTTMNNIYVAYNGISKSPKWSLNIESGLYALEGYLYQSSGMTFNQMIPTGNIYSRAALKQFRMSDGWFGDCTFAYLYSNDVPTSTTYPTSGVRTVGLNTNAKFEPLTSLDIKAREINSYIAAGSIFELWEV